MIPIQVWLEHGHVKMSHNPTEPLGHGILQPTTVTGYTRRFA